MNYLFVCTLNEHRSPTAENVFKEILKERNIKGNVKSAGIDPDARNKLTSKLVRWADKIYVMEQYHRELIIKIDPNSKNKIRVLNINDFYLRNDPALVNILKQKLKDDI